jgi:hypothetical protein
MKFLTRRIEDKIRITRYQGEELKHFQLIGRLMSELGVDMDAYVKNRRKTGARFTGDDADTQLEDWIDEMCQDPTLRVEIIAAGYIDSIRPVMGRCGLRFPKRGEPALELPAQVDLVPECLKPFGVLPRSLTALKPAAKLGPHCAS